MCGLCGVFGVENHWTAGSNRRPAADGEEDSAGAQSANIPERRRERRHRIDLVNRMIAPTRINVREWQGTAYLISSPTGRTEVADNLQEIWQAVEAIRGKPFDPLVMVGTPGT